MKTIFGVNIFGLKDQIKNETKEINKKDNSEDNKYGDFLVENSEFNPYIVEIIKTKTSNILINQ